MPRSGYGFGSISRLVNLGAGPPNITLSPGDNWNGNAGSGFTSTPGDPPRLTAKPILRLITPPGQRYSESLTIGVRAAANNSGTLFDSDGLSTVRVHCEGNVIDIAAPGVRGFYDASGSKKNVWGWWCDLEYTGNGSVDVFFEAVPIDTSMQSRVIGPYRFHPNTADWDFDFTVDPGQPISSTNFHDVNPAINALKLQGATGAARVRIEKAGAYQFTDRNWNRGSDAEWLVIEGSVPGVRFVQPLAGDGTPNYFRPRFEPVCFRTCELDFSTSSEYYFEPGWNHENWFDRCSITNSNDRQDTPLKKPRNGLAWIFRGRHWITECDFSNLWNCVTGQHLVRNCTFTDCWSDLANGTYAFIGNTVEDFDGGYFRTGFAALGVNYTGSASTATIAASGIGPKTFTLREDGSTIDTFTAQTSKSAFLADTNYTVQNVADWINAQPNWSATVSDDTFAAFALCLETGTPQAAFSEQDVKNSPLTLHAKFDIHADIYQLSGNATAENIVIAENRMWELDAQNIFLTAPGGCNDALVANNAFSNSLTSGAQSQLTAEHSHVIMAQNTFASQIVALRSDSTYDPDGYCLIANNVSTELRWGGTADSDATVSNNHVHAGGSDPAGSSGTTIGGDSTTLFVNAGLGDFAPVGPLLNVGHSPVTRNDVRCVKRSTFGAVGAVGKPIFG